MTATSGQGGQIGADPRCGTEAGYRAHRKRDEETCRACRDATNARSRARRKPKGQQPRPRTHRQARGDIATAFASVPVKVTTSGCHLWQGQIKEDGYGKFCHQYVHHGPHRVAYELAKGPIPAGMVIDHRCHTDDPTCNAGDACLHRRCVNPAHLEVVTDLENRRRGRSKPSIQRLSKHCEHGHEWKPETTKIVVEANGETHRKCLVCRRIRDRKRYYARKAAKAVVGTAWEPVDGGSDAH